MTMYILTYWIVLKKKEPIVYFWTSTKLDKSEQFFFKESNGRYYWTIIPKREFDQFSGGENKVNNPQNWLESNYSDKNTKQIKFNSDTSLQLTEKGELAISDYPELEKIYKIKGSDIKNITKVTINNCPKLKEINVTNFVDNEKLEINNCPNLEKLFYCESNKLAEIKGLDGCSKLIKLYCWENQLSNLDISNCLALKRLECSANKLTSLDLSKLKKIEYLKCSDNQLKKLDLSKNKELTKIYCFNNQINRLILPEKLDNLETLNCWDNRLNSLDFLGNLNPQKLNDLDLSDNNFPISDLTVFSPFTELKELWILAIDKPGNFKGSLKALQDLDELKILSIEGNDIDDGLEYLTDKLKEFYCSGAKIIEQKLKKYGKPKKKDGRDNFATNLQSWKKDKQELVEKDKFRSSNWREWKNIDPDFTSELQKKWEDRGFNYEECQKWIKKGLKIDEFSFATYLRSKNLGLSKKQRTNSRKSQNWLDQNYPKKGRKQVKELFFSPGYEVSRGIFDLSDFVNLEKLECGSYQRIVSLDLTGCIKLKELDCRENKLINLVLSNCTNLKELNCSNNNLSYLDLSQNINLEKLDITWTKFPQENPTWLSHLVNLKELILYMNKFTGSLVFTKDMSKLEKLNISGNDFIANLEYLPLSLKEIEYGKEISEELEPYNHDLSLWREFHPELMKKAGKEPVIANYNEIELKKITTIPNFLQEELKKDVIFSVNYNPKLVYSEFLLRDPRSFAWENRSESNPKKDLPLRLYNLQTNQVEATESKVDITNYFTVSYYWGNFQEESSNRLTSKQKKELDRITSKVGYQNSERLTKLGYKSLKKVIKVGQLLGVNYFWMDQLCINQNGSEDKNQEVPKMRHYYSHSGATLIAIDAEVGKEINKENKTELTNHILTKIVTSPWFARSWTFQEGLLSKQTIFMFDDYLVDGRMLALAWGGSQGSSWKPNTLQISITPLGWSYGAQEQHKVNLNLGEALLSVSHRKQTVPVDGVYSILGLLPYGNKVKINYQPFGHKYSEEELEQTLFEVVKENINQGYEKEIFTFFGPRSNNYWWIPQIQANGSTSIGKITADYQYYLLKNMQISLQGIQLESEVYRIEKIFPKDMYGDIPISKENKFKLSKGVPETLERIQIGDSLVVIGKGRYNYPSILIPGNSSYPIDIVELHLDLEEKERYEKTTPQKIFVDLVNKGIISGQKNIDHYQKLNKNKDQQSELINFLEWNKWKIIHPNFTEKLVQQWKEEGFSYGQTYESSSVFDKEFNPSEIDFYVWLRDEKKMKAKECEDNYSYNGKIEKSNSELREQLIIEYTKHTHPQFKQSELYGGSEESYYRSFNDLITIRKTINWTEIEAILIREIEISYDNYGIKGIQCTYQVKSKGNWKLIQGESYDKSNKSYCESESKKTAIIELVKGEYLTNVEGKSSNRIDSLVFHTTNSRGEAKIYGSYGIEYEQSEFFSLPTNNDKQASVFYGKVYDTDEDTIKSLKSLGIQQIPHQITKEDWELIAQIEIPPKNNHF